MTTWTKEELQAIEEAYKQGIRRVRFRDREVEYRSLDEMRAIVAQAQRSVSGSVRSHYFAKTARGYQ